MVKLYGGEQPPPGPGPAAWRYEVELVNTNEFVSRKVTRRCHRLMAEGVCVMMGVGRGILFGDEAGCPQAIEGVRGIGGEGVGWGWGAYAQVFVEM